MKLLIAIVNFKSADLVAPLLDSLASECRQLGGIKVRVGDNGSGDGSFERLAAHVEAKNYGDFAEVLDLAHNGGFAWGNNRLIEGPLRGNRGERPEYVLFLNPDTLATPRCLRTLIEFMDSTPEAGLAGSQLIDPGPNPAVQASAFRFQGFFSEIDDTLRFGPVSRLLSSYKTKMPHPETSDAAPYPCEWVAGASMIVRPEVFEAIGLMDEAFFLYFEEEDFVKRANDAGFSCWYLPSSRVVHLVGATSGITNKKDALNPLPEFWYESRKRYFLTHYGYPKALAVDLARLVALGLYWLRTKLEGKPKADPRGFARGIWKQAWRSLGSLGKAEIPSVRR